jgi:hypothetical protein
VKLEEKAQVATNVPPPPPPPPMKVPPPPPMMKGKYKGCDIFSLMFLFLVFSYSLGYSSNSHHFRSHHTFKSPNENEATSLECNSIKST